MKKIFYFFLMCVSLACIPPLLFVSYVGYEIYQGDYSHLEKSRIIEILSKETNLYYADGKTQLGSLFGSEHRFYVPLHAIPENLKKAVVAAEDEAFYRHYGVDFQGLLRAAFRTFVLRRREGASTITQQTVKNLYGRSVTNVRTKFVEIINALKMERKFSKDEILEFYLNQFHVAGNGRGVGVGAKYYFNKDVQSLTLTESAFIAGSVKGPFKYNPFTKLTKEASQRAKDNAFTRKNYVIKRMLIAGFITQAEYDAAKDEPIPFRQGRFQFNELAITELVQRQLARPEVLRAVGAESVDAIGTMGLHITTTLEREAQTGALYGMRQNLSRLEMILSGFAKEPASNFQPIQRPDPMGFYVAKVTEVQQKPPHMKVSLGLPECEVPAESLDRVAKILDQGVGRGVEKSRQKLLQELAVGDHVLVSVKETQTSPTLVCDLERRPKIQGGVIALDKGHIVAMVGGYSPNEYNRAVFAKRQPGSTFKSLTFYPAMQMGWSVLDSLVNIRSVYQWQGQLYFPRPDHPPESTETTIVGAGSKSENLASVWLMSRLTDRLLFNQLRDLLIHLDLLSPGEPENVTVQRISSKFNLRFTEDQLRAGILASVVDEFANEIGAVRMDPVEKATMRTLQLGPNFAKEIVRLQGRVKGLPPKERLVRLSLLKNELGRWVRLAQVGSSQLLTLKALMTLRIPVSREDRQLLSNFAYRSDIDRLCYVSSEPFEFQMMSQKFQDVPFQHLPVDSLLPLVMRKPHLINEEHLMLDCAISVGMIRDIEGQLDQRAARLGALTPLEKLFWHRDFRYSLGMYYAQQMVRHMGVDSKVEWVPSFPLGANVVTLGELALAYQTLLNGKTYQYFERGNENQLLIIKRIEDAQGNLVWEPQSQVHQLIDPDFSPPILSVLRGTVTHGTARVANTHVILRSAEPTQSALIEKLRLRIPTFGKTGTTNDYTNATYVGFLPYPTEKNTVVLDSENMITIAAYVGYDTNEPMRKGGFRVAGGTGALPAWIEAAAAIIKERKYDENIDWRRLTESNLKEVPFDYGSGLTRIRTGVHGGAVTVESGVDQKEGEESFDLNAYINDYAASSRSQLGVNLPGKFRSGVFIPDTKIHFFDPKPVRPEPTTTLPKVELDGPGKIKEETLTSDEY